MYLKPISTIALILLLAISCAPEAPSIIQELFTKQFKNARDVSWIKGNNDGWEVSFYQNKFQYKTVAYQSNGKWLSTKIEVPEIEVPNELLLILKKQFPKSYLIKTFNKNTSTENHFEFEIEEEGIFYVLGFTANNELEILEYETYRLQNEFIIEND